MKCPQCNNEVYIDHVVQKDDTTTYFYACVNPNCGMYRKAFNLTGETSQAQIQPPKENNS